jgi:bifunctional non-homologous end joining protein LigD
MPLHPEAVPDFRFIPPCSPVPAKAVPAGEGWVHEVKFDGYRVQAHKVGSRVVLFSRNGHDFTDRFPSIAQLLRELPAKTAMLDGEVVASDADGHPNFARLHVRWGPGRAPSTCGHLIYLRSTAGIFVRSRS